MNSRRKCYTASEKLAVVKYAEEHGNRAASRHFGGINEANIRGWRNQKELLQMLPQNKKAVRGSAPRIPTLVDLTQNGLYPWRGKVMVTVGKPKMTLEAIRYKRGTLSILDQLLLPLESKYIKIRTVKDGWDAIHQMKVRGAPAIAIVGCLSLAKELNDTQFATKEELRDTVFSQMEFLTTSRPTAVNMKQAAEEFATLAKTLAQQDITLEDMKEKILLALENMLQTDVSTNKAIGEHGANHILENFLDSEVRVLTHCNTGSLATAGYGTALGVIRSLHSKQRLEHVYCTETRPYNQGSRLTAYELVVEQIPATLICDSAVGWLFKTQKIAAVLVGADRVAANGDTANKIGTYQLSILAKHHAVPFYVAAPTSTIDFSLEDGSNIPIEERPHEEITSLKGIRIAAPGIECWNPAFDVTPATLITGGIITEYGVFPPNAIKSLNSQS